MNTIELAAGELRASLAPEVGGSIAGFGGMNGGAFIHWLRPATAGALARREPLAMASFPLVPFCNRIRNGRASFEGREIRFPPNHPASDSPHPLHGIGWQRPWAVVATSEATAELALEVEGSEAWPWRFSATQRFELRDDGLEVRMSLSNRDTAAMPAGIGHHPYFPRPAGTRLRVDTAAQWMADDEVMPVALQATDTVARLRAGVAVDEVVLDNNFTGWSRHARIDWLADGEGSARSLKIAADAPLDFFVLYTPPGADHFCAEPVSQCTDWLNLLDTPDAQSVGGTRLEPGETLNARFSLLPHLEKAKAPRK